MNKHSGTIQFKLQGDGTSAIMLFSGDWRLAVTAENLQKPIEMPSGIKSLFLKDDGIVNWDGALLLKVKKIMDFCQARQVAIDITGVPDGVQKMLEMANAVPLNEVAAEESQNLFLLVGQHTEDVLLTICEIMEFVGDMVTGIVNLFTGRSRMRGCDFTLQLTVMGPMALPIVSLIGFLMGVILAFIGAIPLQWFKAEIYVASLVGIGMMRMLAPVMVAVVMAGRSSAACAAELGTMRVNQEIDAFTVLGMPAVDLLIMPRFMAMTLMFPVLAVYADIISILGGALVAMTYMHISWMEFYNTMISTVRFSDFYVGIFSSVVFGVLVASCGCYQGIKCGRNASAVGNATTAAVVNSIICIVIATALITFITVLFGI